MIPPIHPFPARMAPELALETLSKIPMNSAVLDPMAGSGTVLRHACELGHRAIGFDMDPLAILMAKVWTQPVSDDAVEAAQSRVLALALSLDPAGIELPWIDTDAETEAFIDFWFGAQQKKDLRCLAYSLHTLHDSAKDDEQKHAIDVLKIALSRIIITKEQCASLARDTSHSRPHRVALVSDYSVFHGFERSIAAVRKRLRNLPPKGNTQVTLGDARAIRLLDRTVDVVLTSPPYLNAIDYMRGHRMSLVWLGHRLKDLRAIRSSSIGAERGPDLAWDTLADVRHEMGDVDALPSRYRMMIDRYVLDVAKMVGEIARVLKVNGSATFVVGNSCLKGVFIKNAEAVAKAAHIYGLNFAGRYERELPNQSRYLPVSVAGALGKRMRTETILTFKKEAAAA